jgi:spermidine/putrescine transport system substrate-binding protein
MKRILPMVAVAASFALPAFAEGELNVYNWGNYTNPELITKFETETGIKVTVTDYDSNDTALAKVKAGGHGFDVVVPSGTYIPIWVGEGLLLETKPNTWIRNGSTWHLMQAGTTPCLGNGAPLV